MTDLPPGSIFAGYRIEAVAGHGGMGVVYRATDLSLDRPVALKFIAAEFGHDEEFRRRFAEESRTAASLDHPNVIPIYQAGEQDGALFLAMRYVEGQDLRGEIAGHGALDPDRVVAITAQIAAALDTAHAAGLVHRDVKPANILLTASDHAYLTDFGLTKRLLAEADGTETGHLLGTLNYVAPEQIRGGTVGPRTDVYALGCVLFHALTGRAPFTMKELERKLWAHVSEPPPPVGPGVPAAFDAVIARAMAKQDSDRFESAGELAAAAAEAAEGARRREPAVERGVETDEPVAELPREQTSSGTASVAEGQGPPVSRRDYRRALARNALLAPFSLAVFGGTLIAGLLFGSLPIVVAVALLAYAAAVAVIYFDKDVQQKVFERRRAKGRDPATGRGPRPPQAALPEGSLSPRIGALLAEAVDKQARIRNAIDRADLPYEEVSEEVGRLVATMRQTAARAELLHEGLRDAPPDAVSRRLEELKAEHDDGKAELIDALREQLTVQQRMQRQLDHFYARMEGMLVEFDTIRGHLISVSASTEVDNQQRLAAQVQGLREEAGALAAGMAAAYEEQAMVIETERK